MVLLDAVPARGAATCKGWLPSPGGQTCGNVCFKDSDCLTSGGFGCTRCSSYDTGAHGTATKPTRIAKTKGIKAATLPTIPTPSPT